ncbi:hypothetical protein [Actinocorallia longicatena]|uniref:DoxX-like protein n=1 Tax=Actinocorallia longicatena TaxID=111803 RepID=A0ABP6QNS3_9ACTN
MPNFRTAGIVLAATGAAHLIVPKPFEVITRPLFPNDTATWVKRNGVTELAIGAAVAVPETRRPGLAALAVYGGWLLQRAAASRRPRD